MRLRGEKSSLFSLLNNKKMNILSENKALWFKLNASLQVLVPVKNIDFIGQAATGKVLVKSGNVEVTLEVDDADVPKFLTDLYRVINFGSTPVIVVADDVNGVFFEGVTGVEEIDIEDLTS